jgi:hypothetical protein
VGRAPAFGHGVDQPEVNMRPVVDKSSGVVPTGCPACQSTEIATTSKTIDAATYWRCRKCGEVWNVGRRRDEPVWQRQRYF